MVSEIAQRVVDFFFLLSQCSYDIRRFENVATRVLHHPLPDSAICSESEALNLSFKLSDSL